MYKSTMLVAALAATVTAQDSPWVWSVSGFQGGCSPAACTFEFNVTAETYNGYFKGFTALCEGNTLQNNGNYVLCSQPEEGVLIGAKIGDFVQVDGQQKIQTYVSYKYNAPVLPNSRFDFNFTGIGAGRYGQQNPGSSYPNDPDSFRIEPNSVTIEPVSQAV